ncbi:MAG: ATP-binding protein, partial [Myxococcales bacterium]|nr:ATP-binding protein [Myxococcales bacterium]
MSTAAASDPFESTANPAHYVARPACEGVLGALEQRIRQGTHPVALTGPAGFGKTFLLQVLSERLRGTFRVVGLPYPALSGPELCRWVLDSLGAAAGDDPEGSLLDFAFRTASEHGEILILVDDASALPPGT